MEKTNMRKMGEHIALDRKVEVIGLDVVGTIAFIGPTQFGDCGDPWLGLTLDIPRGK